MSLGEAIGYVGFFGMAWIAVLLLAAALDNALRTVFNMRLFPDNYFSNTPVSRDSTHCFKCGDALPDRNFCRNCGEQRA
jgi:hypothetical protein